MESEEGIEVDYGNNGSLSVYFIEGRKSWVTHIWFIFDILVDAVFGGLLKGQEGNLDRLRRDLGGKVMRLSWRIRNTG